MASYLVLRSVTQPISIVDRLINVPWQKLMQVANTEGTFIRTQSGSVKLFGNNRLRCLIGDTTGASHYGSSWKHLLKS